MALHKPCIIANQSMWLVFFRQRAVLLQQLKNLFKVFDFVGSVLYSLQVFFELTCDFECKHSTKS